MTSHIPEAKEAVSSVLRHAIRLEPGENVLVVFDTESDLARILKEAYAAVLPDAKWIEFDSEKQELVRDGIFSMKKGDLVVLIQSTNFRLNEFRIRIELFQRGMKTIEHMHLNRMTEDQYARYLEALAYDPEYYRPLGHAVKKRIDDAKSIVVECEGASLNYESPMEPAKLNIGDYSKMQNVGGTFPIGEVFSEPTDLSAVNGEIKIFAFAGIDHIAREYEPFRAVIKNGILEAGDDAPQEFHDVLDLIRETEPVHVREFGLGLNPAIGKGRILNDVTAFERMKGLHMSLGAKHGVYKKQNMPAAKHTRYHVDIFVDAKRILVDGEVLFEGGEFNLVPSATK